MNDSPQSLKIPVPTLLRKQWKYLSRGRGARHRSRRFREAAMKHLNIKSDGYFYQIMNGKVEMFEVDVQELKRLINNYKDLLR